MDVYGCMDGYMRWVGAKRIADEPVVQWVLYSEFSYPILPVFPPPPPPNATPVPPRTLTEITPHLLTFHHCVITALDAEFGGRHSHCAGAGFDEPEPHVAQ